MHSRPQAKLLSQFGIPLVLSITVHLVLIFVFYGLITLLPKSELLNQKNPKNSSHSTSDSNSNSENNTLELLVDLSTLNNILTPEPSSDPEDLLATLIAEAELAIEPEPEIEPEVTEKNNEPSFTQTPEEASILPPENTTKISNKDSLVASQTPLPSGDKKDLPNIEQKFVGGIQGYKDQRESTSINPLPTPTSVPLVSVEDNTASNGLDRQNKKGLLNGVINQENLSQINNQSRISDINSTQQVQPKLFDIGTGKIIPIPEDTSDPLQASKKQTKQASTTIVSIHQTGYYRVDQDGDTSNLGPDAESSLKNELGVFKTKVTELINTRFQNYCRKHYDYIVPGFVTVEFQVDSKGKVKNLKLSKKIDSTSNLGAIQEGFTIRAIRLAPITAMNEQLIEQLNNEPTFFKMNFFF